MDSLTLLCKVTPITIILYLTVSLLVFDGVQPWLEVSESVREHYDAVFGGALDAGSSSGGTKPPLLYHLLLLKGSMAAVYLVTDLMVIRVFGSLTSAVLGNLSRICLILCSLWYFGNSVSPVQVAGFSTVFVGVIMHLLLGSTGKAKGSEGMSKKVKEQ
eukprot:Hpha_TRINITY_DN9238_c0_g1::TRINITY_DN9238_c0_g1_i1::g.28485::m.28485